MTNRKAFLKDKIEEYRFLPIEDCLFDYYDEYEELCKAEDDQLELVSLAFCRGEAFFRQGDYLEAERILNECVVDCHIELPYDLLAKCHNLIGLINIAMGQELLSLENYLAALDYAVKSGDNAQKVVTLLNIAWLYRDLEDYNKALEHCYKAQDILYSDENDFTVYNLEILLYTYIGQLHFKNNDPEKACEAIRLIEESKSKNPTLFYDVPVLNLFVRYYHYIKDNDKLQETIDTLIKFTRNQDDFIEFSESFLDIVEYIITFSQKNARRFMDALHINIDSFSIYFLQLRLQRLEVMYAEKYSDEEAFLQACGKYIRMESKYNSNICYSKLCSLQRLELLKNIQKERQLYFEQSRQDLMTGLLNKVSFEEMIERMLTSRTTNLPAACTLVVLDLDNFKKVNDTLGHINGDKIILAVARSLTKVFGENALLGRVGGDEFAAFLPNSYSSQDVFQQAIELQHEFAATPDVIDITENHDIKISISVGIMFDINTPLDYENAFKRADKQLYLAKASGKNIICIESAEF